MSKNTQISELINYISVDGSGNIVMTGNLIMPGGVQAATQTYVNTAISNLVNAAPAALDTLAELSTALNNDASFATTITNSLATKLALSGGTLTGALNGTTISLVGTNNVGIKLKQGNQIFDVPASTNFYNGLTFENTSTTNAWSIGYSQGAKFSINYFDGSSSYTRFLSITTGGSFGIGVLSPERVLDIDAVGSAAAIRLRKGSANMIFLGTGSGSSAAGTENAILQMHHNGSERIRLYAEGNSWITGGNLGVGTAAPNSKLTLSRDTESTAYQLELRNTGGINDGNYDGIRFTQGSDGSTPLGSIRLKYKSTGYPDLGIFTRSGDLTETERLVILNGGNIGINTPSPLEKLSITGNVHIAGVGNGLMFDTDASGRSISQYVANLYEFHILNARGNSSRFVLGNGSVWLGTSSTPQLYINTSSGNVGMGTTNFSNLAFGSTLLKVAGSRATLGLQSSGTLSTIALISGDNTATAMHLNYENTGAFRWYNYTSATETFTLLGNGRLGLGVSSPDARLHVGGAILVSNGAQTFRRAIVCNGATGTYTEVKVIFNKTNWGSVTYDIKLASAGGSFHTAGAYYSNPGFSSHVNSINAGNGPSMSLTADSPNGGSQGATWRFYGATMIHPMVTIDIASGNGYQVNPDDIIVQFN